MAALQSKRNVQKLERQHMAPKDQGKERPQPPHRTSARLQEIQWCQEQTVAGDRNTVPKQRDIAKQSSQSLLSPLQVKDRKQKQTQEPEGSTICDSIKPIRKRPRTTVALSEGVDTSSQEVTSGPTDDKVDPIDYWRKQGRWPEEYFKQDDQVREDFKKDFEKDSWYEKYWLPNINMNHLLARKKSLSSLRGKQLEAGSAGPTSTTPSDQRPREVKSTTYQSMQYKILLETKGIFMRKSELDITDASKSLCRTLLEAEQAVLVDSLFQDDIFDETCEMIRDRNEAKVIQDISRLIVPSAQSLAIRGAKDLKILIESINEGWNSSIPITKPRPQPDYSVGFKWTAFTEEQLKKLRPFVGDFSDSSFFMAMYYMYFPFLTCEVKCGAAALDVADRQNAHSMTLAVRGVVELFRLKNREKELHREILAFSISHDDRMVRIYGHYPVIDGLKTTFYRHLIRDFSFLELDGKEKWTAYKFTKNVYDTWMPTHFKRICSVIDELPLDVNFEVSELPSSEAFGLSQVFEDQSISQASQPDITWQAGNDHSQSSVAGSQGITPDTSLTHETHGGAFKKPKKRRAAE